MVVSMNKVTRIPQPFAYLRDKEYVVFDTQTTGLSPSAEICEICIMDGLTGKLLLNTLVKPVNPIQEGAMRIHGITEEMVEDAPTWGVISQAVRRLAKGKVGVAYNAQFDIDMLVQSSNAMGEIVDPLFNFEGYFCAMREYAKRAKIYHTARSAANQIKLSKACEYEEIDIPSQRHRAFAEAQLTHQLVKQILIKNEQEIQQYV
jgi:DNA polymerase-3 subunit epsilon